MTRLFFIGSAIGLTLASSVAFAGGHVRDHRHGGARFGDAPGGVRVYHGHRPRPGYRDPQISPAPSGGYGSGSTIRDHRGLKSPLVKGPFF
jgi:hypothetical protein